jgi:hypothetical protein
MPSDDSAHLRVTAFLIHTHAISAVRQAIRSSIQRLRDHYQSTSTPVAGSEVDC